MSALDLIRELDALHGSIGAKAPSVSKPVGTPTEAKSEWRGTAVLRNLEESTQAPASPTQTLDPEDERALDELLSPKSLPIEEPSDHSDMARLEEILLRVVELQESQLEALNQIAQLLVAVVKAKPAVESQRVPVIYPESKQAPAAEGSTKEPVTEEAAVDPKERIARSREARQQRLREEANQSRLRRSELQNQGLDPEAIIAQMQSEHQQQDLDEDVEPRMGDDDLPMAEAGDADIAREVPKDAGQDKGGFSQYELDFDISAVSATKTPN